MLNDLFDVVVNPFGPLYNPASILSALKCLEQGETICESELFEHEGLWHHWMFHSRYSRETPEATAEVMSRSVRDASEALRRAEAVIVTFGTTTAYARNGQVVANCHKQPQNRFEKINFTLEETERYMTDIVDIIRSVNQNAFIIFTVSPLRYLSDGARANTIIKATLNMAVEALTDRIIYFPAYEIMNDDLRDYRFYASDMLHPSDVAVKYIYDIFGMSFYEPETMKIAGEARKLTRRLSHRGTANNMKIEIPELDILKRYPVLENGYKRFIK